MTNPFGRLMGLARKVASGRAKSVFAVFDVKRQSLQSLTASNGHEQRTMGDLSHVDHERTHLNQRMAYGGFKDSPKDAVEKYLKDKDVKIDKRNTTPITTFVLSASPEYFEMKDGEANPKKLNEWKLASMNWAMETFGSDLVHSSLHLDEKTPHLHLHTVPTYEKKTKRKTVRQASHHKHEFFKGRKSFERCLTSYTDAVAHLGINRGQRLPEGAKGTTRTARQWVNEMARKIADPAKALTMREAIVLEKEKQVAERENEIYRDREDLGQYRNTLNTFAIDLEERATTVRRDAKKVSAAISAKTVKISDSPVRIPEVPKRVEKRTRRKKKVADSR